MQEIKINKSYFLTYRCDIVDIKKSIPKSEMLFTVHLRAIILSGLLY
jgi:hypothetical protein